MKNEGLIEAAFTLQKLSLKSLFSLVKNEGLIEALVRPVVVPRIGGVFSLVKNEGLIEAFLGSLRFGVDGGFPS